MYDTQITVCPVFFLSRQNVKCWSYLCCWSPNGMNPKPILGLPNLETNSGSPRIWDCFLGLPIMSPFWNHILAKKGRFIHVRSQISWYVCSMYLGTKGGGVLTCTFCALLPRCCVLLCGSSLSYVCTVQFLKLQILCWSTNCVRMRMVLMTICRARKWKKKFWFHAVSYTQKK